MLRIWQEVRNGQVFKIEEEYEIVTEIIDSIIHETEAIKYRAEEYICEEYSMIILATKEKIDTTVKISGTIFEQRYTGEPLEIFSDVALKINKQAVGMLTSVGGIVEFNITIVDASIEDRFRLRAEHDTIISILEL